MPSPILDSLPAIHTTVIGFGGAFFSAFALYAYQQVQETKDQLERVLREVETFSTPNSYISSPVDLLLENGELDWDGKAKQILHEAKSHFSTLDYEEKYGIPKGSFERSPLSDEQLILSCRSLCNVLHYVFVSYPLTGRSMGHFHGITEKLEEKKRVPFDNERLREVERRISFLRWCWETSNRSIMELAQRCTLAEQQNKHKEQRAAFEENMARLPTQSKEEQDRLWTTFHLPHIAHSIDYGKIVSDYFDKIMAYEKNVLPALHESLRVHDLYNQRFQVRALSLWMIAITVAILLLGVFLPPVMQSAQSDFGVCWHPAVEYALLAVTAVPYFLVCWWLYRKLLASNFR
ncbi:MAG: hypothetical protein V4607_16420 [Pseudomonadota bacterium]